MDATFWDRVSSEPFLGVIVGIIGSLVALVSGMLFWLVARSLWYGRVRRLRDAFWHGLGRELVGVIGDPDAEAAWIARARSHHPDVLRYCLNEYMIRTCGDYKEGCARLYRNLGLLDRDLAELAKAGWSSRMRALRRVASVVTEDHRAEVAALAGAGGEIRLLVAQIMGRIGTVDDIVALLGAWRITSRLSEYPVHVMVESMGPDVLRGVVARWDDLGSSEIQRIVLGAAAKSVPGACWSLLPRAACDPSIEVRIAACHAARAITSPATLGLVVELAKDETWEVRAQAMKALATHHGEEAAAVLLAALSDGNFWVRQNAAQALASHGPGGIARLEAVARSAGDRYARDAADHVLTALALGRGDSAPTSAGPALAAGGAA
ncbi:MAG: HEAT repeat domain-containing protein [Myxococcales bacterium]|nr:HEAT repeat domain-containing protein [Myxococcales bacterium]